jgi:hypothetical protein
MNQYEKNQKLLKEEIQKKNSFQPYFSNYSSYHVMNDHDSFPYPKFYRGRADSNEPIVYERVAGWTPRKIPQPLPPITTTKPNYCFQAPCSTVYPCYATESNSYYYLNKACINEKR